MKMRNFWPLLMAGSVGAMGVQAATVDDYQLLVGSYTAGQSQGIYRLNFDSATGQIDAKPLQVVKSENPSWLTVSKDQHHLFVVNENGPGKADPVRSEEHTSELQSHHDIVCRLLLEKKKKKTKKKKHTKKKTTTKQTKK